MNNLINTKTGHLNRERRTEDGYLIEKFNEILKEKRGYVVKIPKESSAVTIPVSGGIDSICQLFILLNDLKLNVYPCFIDRGQSNIKAESASVDYFNKYFSKRFPNHFHEIKKIKVETPAKEYKEDLIATKKLKDDILLRTDISYPVRNPIIFLTAMEYAYSLQSKGVYIDTVFLSLCKEDNLYHSSLTSLRSLNILICHITNNWNWQIISLPIEEEFQNCYEKEVYMKHCLENGLPLEFTRTCTNKGKNHCGQCACCWDRRNGFKNAKAKDLTVYDNPLNDNLSYAERRLL